MNRILSRKWKRPLSNQRGMALITSLLFLLILTLLGLAGMQGSLIQERMAGNYEHRNFAFQAAEAGLRDAEAYLKALDPTTDFNNSGGLYTPAASDQTPRWETVDWTDNTKYRIFSEGDLVARYVVEYVSRIDGPTIGSVPGVHRSMYRITSRGTSSNGLAVVRLQTTYVK